MRLVHCRGTIWHWWAALAIFRTTTNLAKLNLFNQPALNMIDFFYEAKVQIFTEVIKVSQYEYHITETSPFTLTLIIEENILFPVHFTHQLFTHMPE